MNMNLLEGMKKNSTIYNTKGSKYYATTYNYNLDVFSMLTRYNYSEKIISTFNAALMEDEDLALANLLYILDIRGGKGERLLFKTIYKDLCVNHSKQALRILPFIKELGRFDYLLIGIETPIEEDTIKIIKKQLEEDKNSDSPSLLAKWLPSHRTHNKNNDIARKLQKLLGMSEKQYRQMLSGLRTKINIVEKNLSRKTYDNIDFERVPAKAMLKYNKAYGKHMKERFELYKNALVNDDAKIKTTGLFVYEIISKVLLNKGCDIDIYNSMWKNQKELFIGNDTNLLVVADTSGSMTQYNAIPYCTSIGLALYIAERNKGFFKNHFITFSEVPTLQEVIGDNLIEKIKNMREINARNTDIDKVFDLILKTSIKNKLRQEELPSHILIISDMEFDHGVYSKNGTNFSGWKKAFVEKGYKLPNIIFWNVACFTRGTPITNFDNDVAIVSGFSTNILENLLTLDKYTPTNLMLEKLAIYLEMLKINPSV